MSMECGLFKVLTLNPYKIVSNNGKIKYVSKETLDLINANKIPFDLKSYSFGYNFEKINLRDIPLITDFSLKIDKFKDEDRLFFLTEEVLFYLYPSSTILSELLAAPALFYHSIQNPFEYVDTSFHVFVFEDNEFIYFFDGEGVDCSQFESFKILKHDFHRNIKNIVNKYKK